MRNSVLQLEEGAYCTRCHAEINRDYIVVTPTYDIARSQSWCDTCRDMVIVSSCRTPYWTIMATLALSLFVQSGTFS